MKEPVRPNKAFLHQVFRVGATAGQAEGEVEHLLVRLFQERFKKLPARTGNHGSAFDRFRFQGSPLASFLRVGSFSEFPLVLRTALKRQVSSEHSIAHEVEAYHPLYEAMPLKHVLEQRMPAKVAPLQLSAEGIPQQL